MLDAILHANPWTLLGWAAVVLVSPVALAVIGFLAYLGIAAVLTIVLAALAVVAGICLEIRDRVKRAYVQAVGRRELRNFDEARKHLASKEKNKP